MNSHAEYMCRASLISYDHNQDKNQPRDKYYAVNKNQFPSSVHVCVMQF